MRSLLLALALFMAFPAFAADVGVTPAQAAQIRKAIPDLKIDGIRKGPIQGLFELQVGRMLYYTDQDGSHLIAGGHIFETATHNDLTRARMEELNRISWKVLPLDKAIVSGDPKGKLQVAIFTDPDCPFCRRLEQELVKVQGVKVYTFLFPLKQIHPDAYGKAVSIWCSKDQHQALMDVMLKDAKPAAGKCKNPIDEIVKLGDSLGISGTPTLIAGDGRMYAGGKSADDLVAWLQEK